MIYKDMKRILNFGGFLRINEAKATDINSMLLRDLSEFITKRLVNTLTSLPSFGGFELDDLGNGEYDILYTWRGENMSLGIVYNPSIPLGDWKSTSGRFRYNDVMSDMFPDHSKWKIRNYIDGQMEGLIKMEKESAGDFNPFDADIESLQVIKDIKDIGATIVSTPIERKNGTVAIKFPNWGTVYTLQKTGYIRRKGVSGYLSTKPELIKPILSLEDLIPKVTFVYNIFLKEIAQTEGMTAKEINDVLKAFSVEGGSSESYKNKFEEVIAKHPAMALYLPKPENWEDTGIRQGARLLGRIGIF